MDEKKIVIDAGHGGSDSGAVANGVEEKNLTLKISLYMYEIFKKLGIPVALTRSSDETLNPNERVRRVLEAFGNDPNVVVISNHINSSAVPNTAEGAEVIFALRNTPDLSRNILEEIGKEGQIIRSYYQRALPNDPSKDYYYIHRDTGVTEPVIVEYGFINNLTDLRRIEANYKNYVDAVVRAVLDTFNIETGKYIVQKGDSLWKIAQKYNTTVEHLKEINNLHSDLLTEGQILRVPRSHTQTGNFEYIVQRGDSLWTISQEFNTSVEDLKRLNNLSSNVLSIGQVLKIPNRMINVENDTIQYIVQKGDSLWSISQRFNKTVEEIRRLNNLNNNLLLIGQILLIDQKGVYIVRAGDTLWSIAQKFDTTVQDIKDKNDLTTDVISVGQILKI